MKCHDIKDPAHVAEIKKNLLPEVSSVGQTAVVNQQGKQVLQQGTET